MIETKILHKIAGEDGIEAHVALITVGYSVTAFDADANGYYPMSKIFPFGPDAEALALAHAATINPARKENAANV